MRLLIRNHLKNAIDSLGANRPRSLLTVLGIAIGVTSVVIILSFAGSVQKLMSEQIESAGGNIIVVRPELGRGTEDRNLFEQITNAQSFAGSSLTEEDVETIREIEGVTAVAPLAMFDTGLHGDAMSRVGTVVGTSSELPKIVQLPLRDGYFFGDEEERRAVVIGHRMAMDLFDSIDVVGANMRIRDEVFMIVGLISEMDAPINFNNVDFDRAVLINMERAGELMANLQIQQINVQTENQASLSAVAAAVHEKVLENHEGEEDFTVVYGENINHHTDGLLGVVASMLTLVAGVSLVVGGIGVMNIMLVSVAERVHEIGIKKAVGATNGHVLMQFLFEALILSLLGGLMGFVFGYAFSFGASLFTPFTPVLTREIVLIALGISVAIGCVFGIYPALKAARKNPIDSLRHYR